MFKYFRIIRGWWRLRVLNRCPHCRDRITQRKPAHACPVCMNAKDTGQVWQWFRDLVR